MKEQRTKKRYEVSLTARWPGAGAHHNVRISDLSETGCYVDSIGEVHVGEVISLEISMTEGSLLLKAEVMHHFPRLGFGVKFVEVSPEQNEAIKSLLPGYVQTSSNEASSIDDDRPESAVEVVNHIELSSGQVM